MEFLQGIHETFGPEHEGNLDLWSALRNAHQKALVQLGEAEAPVPGRRRRRRASRLSIVRTAPQAQLEESTRMEPPTSGRVSHTVTDATELEAPRVWRQGIRVAVVEGEPLETSPILPAGLVDGGA